MPRNPLLYIASTIVSNSETPKAMKELFDNKHRIDLDPSQHNENTFDYYDRSARKDVSNVRKLLNEWFLNYPETEQFELKRRFKKTFTSSFYELFIYTLFKQQGFEITIHPDIPNTNKHPDFLLRKNDSEFYLEAKVARDKSKAEEALEKRINQLYDSLDKIKSPNFFLKIDELIIKTTNQPSTKQVINKIETEVAKHNFDTLTEQPQQSGFENMVKIIHDDDNLKLIVSLIPKTPTGGTIEGRAIRIFPLESFCGGSQESIKDSFTRKAKRYGELDKPYFICINAIGILGEGDFDVENALWGSLAWTWSTDPNNRDEKWGRGRDGIFLGKKGARCKNVSGVLVTKVREYNFATATYWFAKHPFSDNEANFELFDLAYYFVESGKILKYKGKTFGEILNIESTWLND